MSRGSPAIFNILTVLVLMAACVVGACFAAVAFNPATVPENLQEQPLPTIFPSPPPTATALIDAFPTAIPATEAGATETPSPSVTATEEASSTEGPSPTASKTGSPTPTATETVTATPTATHTAIPTTTPSGPTATPSQTQSSMPFTIQPGSPTYQPNYANAAGCSWMGVAGQAFDLSGHEIIGLTVRVSFEDGVIDSTTGSNKSYGPGGYEIFLNDHPVATGDAYSIQLFNSSGSVLSDKYSFVTFSDCNRNLVIVNFVQNH